MGLDISSECAKRSETPVKAGRETEASGGDAGRAFPQSLLGPGLQCQPSAGWGDWRKAVKRHTCPVIR